MDVEVFIISSVLFYTIKGSNIFTKNFIGNLVDYPDSPYSLNGNSGGGGGGQK